MAIVTVVVLATVIVIAVALAMAIVTVAALATVIVIAVVPAMVIATVAVVETKEHNCGSIYQINGNRYNGIFLKSFTNQGAGL